MVFNEGRLELAENYRPLHEVEDTAAFPEYTFLELLFGRRSFADLRYAHPDCWGRNELYDLFDTLFPCRPTDLFWVS